MKNLFQKLLCVMLSVVFCAAAFSACKKNDPSTGDKTNPETPKEKPYFQLY